MDELSQIAADATQGSLRLDPITAEVIRCAFDNIADEMAIVLLRTSGSPVLTEAKDFSAVVFDATGRQVEEGRLCAQQGHLPGQSAERESSGRRLVRSRVVMIQLTPSPRDDFLIGKSSRRIRDSSSCS